MKNTLLTHYTDRRNVEAIREKGVLLCALSLMNKREKARWAEERRSDNVPISCGAVLRDQEPLNRERLVFCDGAKFEEFVRYLNGHVFFWPDNYAGEQSRKRFRNKYRHPGHLGIRCRLDDLRAANQKADILYSPYNSGSTPRVPKKSPRHLKLFQPLNKRGNRRLVEVVICGKVHLPQNAEVEYENDKWHSLFMA